MAAAGLSIGIDVLFGRGVAELHAERVIANNDTTNIRIKNPLIQITCPRRGVRVPYAPQLRWRQPEL